MSIDLLSGLWRHGLPPASMNSSQWEILLSQARICTLVPRLAMLFDQYGILDQVPAKPSLYLRNGLLLAQRQVQAVQWEVERIRHAMVDVNTRIVLLKGAAYLMAGLPAARGRLFADIDILVDRSQIANAELALMGAGWVCAERDAYNDRYYRQWMHEIPPLEHVNRATVIDLHHTITPPTSKFNVDGAKLLDHAVPIPGMPGLFVLQPVDMVLHSAVHLFQEGEFDHGLRDLLDLNALLLHFERTVPGFWDCLLARAHSLRLTKPLYHALFHVKRLFNTRPPVDVCHQVQALRPPFPQRPLMAWLLQRALQPDHPTCRTPGHKLARWLLFLRSHWLRMPIWLLVPHLIRKAWMRQTRDQKVANNFA